MAELRAEIAKTSASRDERRAADALLVDSAREESELETLCDHVSMGPGHTSDMDWWGFPDAGGDVLDPLDRIVGPLFPSPADTARTCALHAQRVAVERKSSGVTAALLRFPALDPHTIHRDDQRLPPPPPVAFAPSDAVPSPTV